MNGVYKQTAIDDYREREARKCNVILHNIPEPTSEQADGRKLEDSEQVSDMFQSGLEVDQVQIQSIVRLGKKIQGRARLTKVTLDSVKSKRELLNNAKKLRSTEKWERVYITPDLSPREREENKKLREELKKRRDEGETGIVIRRGKIVCVQERNPTDEEGVLTPAAASQTFRT